MSFFQAAAAAIDYLPQVVVPLPPAQPPPGGAENQILQVVGIVRWGAGVGLITAFFGGLILFGVGRWVDHHRLGRMGTMTMLASVGGAILYAAVPPILNAFASGGGTQ